METAKQILLRKGFKPILFKTTTSYWRLLPGKMGSIDFSDAYLEFSSEGFVSLDVYFGPYSESTLMKGYNDVRATVIAKYGKPKEGVLDLYSAFKGNSNALAKAVRQDKDKSNSTDRSKYNLSWFAENPASRYLDQISLAPAVDPRDNKLIVTLHYYNGAGLMKAEDAAHDTKLKDF